MLLEFIFLLQSCQGYLPGTNQKEYKAGDKVIIFASSLTSSETQLPFDYFYLPYCKGKGFEVESDNIGQALSGDVVEKTGYEVQMNVPIKCKSLCRQAMNNRQVRNFKWMIDRDYRAMWILDSLPSGLRRSYESQQVNEEIYENGFPIGYTSPMHYYVYNHHHIIIKIHPTGENWNIVGFLVQPFSFADQENSVCESAEFQILLERSSLYDTKNIYFEDPPNEKLFDFIPKELDYAVNYTYSVAFEVSKVKWASRWDVYLYTSNSNVHWISIINSFGMVLLLSIIVANIFRRTVTRDISAYNESIESDSVLDSGWKQLNGDIFRPPVYYGIFSVVIGTGIQVISMCIFTLFFASVGFLAPEHRGYLVTTMLLLFAFTGNLAGYTSGRIYKMFAGEHWKQNALATAICFPGVCFSMFFLINLLIRGEDSSGAVPFLSLLELLLIWFGISLPLTFLGAALGYKKPSLSNPTRVSRIPKPSPTSSLKLIYILGLLCGSLPFLSSYIELNYIMTSIWHHSQMYYLFGFLFLCFIVVCLVSGEVSILMIYLLICKEDHRWWWVSIAIPGGSAGYFFVYAIVYYMEELSITRFSSSVLYFGYMIIGSAMFFLVTGTVGFLASFVFVRKIYSLIKLD